MDIRVMFVQGPPGSGKDTVGGMLHRFIPNSKIVKFAEILKNRTHALFGLFDSFGFLPHNAFDATKDQPSPHFMGLTPRQAYIWLSEQVVKPKFGQDVFGKMLAAQMKDDGTVYIVTDSGFVREAEPVIEKFGAERCVVLQVYREGKDFSIDSRGYWGMGRANTFEIQNNGSLEDLKVVAASNAQFFFPHLGEIQTHEPASCHGPRPGSDR